MAFTPAPSASKSFGSEVTAVCSKRFGDPLRGARIPDDMRRAITTTVPPPKWPVKLISIRGKIASCNGSGKSLTALRQQLAGRLLVYCSGLQVACMLGSR
jgi:hypothetical protein